jgi:hypothetical protein
MSKLHPHLAISTSLPAWRHRQNPPVVNSRASPSDALGSALVIPSPLRQASAHLSLLPDSHVHHSSKELSWAGIRAYLINKATCSDGLMAAISHGSYVAERSFHITSLHVLNLQV